MATEVQGTSGNLKQNRAFILGSMSLGHGFAHMMAQSFSLMLPEITGPTGMNLSTVQKASLFAVRQAGSGAVNLGGGPLVDMLKSHWGLILTGCLIWTAIALLMLGSAPNYIVLLIGSALFFIPGTLWHLPSAAALSQRFPDRRGFAISMHGAGANIGTVLGPLIAGALLGILIWEHIFYIYTIPAVLMAGFVWWSLKDLGREGGAEKQKEMKAQYRDALLLLRNPIVLGLMFSNILRSLGLQAVFNWTPFYLKESEKGGLGMGDFEAGFHYSLLIGMGIVSMPVLGAISDKYGRKMVLLPGLIISMVLSLVVVKAGDGLVLIPILAGMGLFSATLQQIIRAALLDVVSRGSEAKAVGMVAGLNGILGIGTPFVAVAIIDHLGGYGSIYFYAAITSGLTALLIFLIPMNSQGAEPARS